MPATMVPGNALFLKYPAVIYIGRKLRNLRLEKGYSQEYVAQQLEMSQAKYSKTEADKISPSFRTFELACNLYNINPLSFLASIVMHTDDAKASGKSIPSDLISRLILSNELVIQSLQRQIEILEHRIRELEAKHA